VTASYVLALLLTDGCATAVRLAGRHWSSASFVPLAALVLEALLAWVVVAHLRVMLRARRLLA
jgi:hypothetical protein